MILSRKFQRHIEYRNKINPIPFPYYDELREYEVFFASATKNNPHI